MKLSTIISLIALILVVVLGGGLVMNFVSEVYLGTPKLTTKDVYLPDLMTGEPRVSDTIVNISEVKDAEYYEIYVDGEYVGYTVKREIAISAWTDHVGGEFEVYVKAVRKNAVGEKVFSKASNVVKATCAAG